ncbi:Histidine kinase domain-containing protein [Sulfidibacter corallicola]|uniref:histidine kinase n=1 Tax=Sulfidibacter corallicola TaxID=2818388 RepID=A0A8A4TX90_SULCO|nr:sensor histidine kinase [Sulfidibacter corallicola]QTD53818.1 hypothetical protein J3U87_15315 [Sulfidibacter corallicola]
MLACRNLPKFFRFPLVATLFALLSLHAQEPQPQFFHLSTKDGLADNTIYDIFQDRRGFLWFCTQNGLSRYDGYRFQHFRTDPGKPGTLSVNHTSAIYGDGSGTLWIATWGGGLNQFDPDTQTFAHYFHDPQKANSLPSNYLQTLLPEGRRYLWIATLDNGLARLDKTTGRIHRFEHDPDDPQSLRHSRVWSLCFDTDDRLWVGTETGIDIYNPDTTGFDHFELPKRGSIDVTGAQVRSMFLDQGRNWWFGTDRGLFRYEPDTGKVRHYRLPPEDRDRSTPGRINTILEDRNGTIWVGSAGGGLYRYVAAEDDFLQFRHHSRMVFTLSGNEVRKVYEDRSGNLWVGTRNAGLNKLNLKPPKFRTIRHLRDDPDSLARGIVKAVSSGGHGDVWFGTETGGLTHYDRDRGYFRRYEADSENPQSLSHNDVNAIAVDGHGTVWIGTEKGLNRKEPDDRFTAFFRDPEDPASLAHDRILSLVARDDALWVGTPNGVSIASLDEPTRFRHLLNRENSDRGFQKQIVRTIAFDPSGDAWIGTAAGKLFQYHARQGRLQSFHKEAGEARSLRNNAVLCLLPKREQVWIGTYGGGLNCLDRRSGQYIGFPQETSLVNNSVFGILEDHHGTLWMSTARGLCRFSPDSGDFHLYDILDGLQGELFAPGAHHQTAWGEMFFGGMDGVSAFFPDQIRAFAYQPPLVISEIQALGRRLNLAGLDEKPLELLMDRNNNVISIMFAALDFTRPEKNSFLYRMEGVDETWIEGDNQAMANYTNLSPGFYRFELKGASHDGTWVTKPLTFSLRVRPLPHQSWLAYTLYGLLVFIALAAAFQFQRMKERQRAKVQLLTQSERMAVEANRSKSAFLAHMSHELRTPLNHIIGYSELIEEDVEDLEPDEWDMDQLRIDLRKIKAAAYYQLSLVNNILELTRIESGNSDLYAEWFDLQSILDNLVGQMNPLLEKSKNRLSLETEPRELGRIRGDQAKLQSMLLNLLTNADKFTNEGRIRFRVLRTKEEDGGWVHFSIQDTGIGMSEQQVNQLFQAFSQMVDHNRYGGTGLGLYVTNFFCRLMGGTISVESKLGAGSTFTIRIPDEIIREEEPQAPTEEPRTMEEREPAQISAR